MADRATIDATLLRRHQAWVTCGCELYRTVWTDAGFADPPTDGEVPSTGFDQILAGMEEVRSPAESFDHQRHRAWHCGHSAVSHPDEHCRLITTLVLDCAPDGVRRR